MATPNSIRPDSSAVTIGIMGTPVSSGNRGVLALGASLVSLCARSTPPENLALLLGHHDNQPTPFRVGGETKPIAVINARLSPRSRMRDHLAMIFLKSLLYRALPFSFVRAAICRSTPWIDFVAHSTLVGDVHGGDSFSDIYGLVGFLYTCVTNWTIILVRGEMVQFPQTYGPFKTRRARWLARGILKRSSYIIARDKQSQALAQELVGPNKAVHLSPDVAFSLEVIRPSEIELVPPLAAPLPTDTIGINVNGLMYHGGYTKNNMFGLKLNYAELLPQLVTELLKETTGEIWLIPHTYAPDDNVESDPAACEKVRAALPPELQSRVRTVKREYDQHEIKGVIGLCDFFIGSRMHSCIAALSQGVPCVGVAYSMKFAGVFESVGVKDWIIDGRTVDNRNALTRVIELYRQRNAVRADLAKASAAARGLLFETFAALVKTGAKSAKK